MGFADGGVLTKGMMAGRSLTSLQQLKGKAFGVLGEAQYALENLHYQQIRNLKVDRTVEAPRGYFGYKYRDKLWTKPDGKTFGEFLERAVTYYMLNVSEATMKSIDGVDLSYLRFNFEKHFGRKITKYEKEAGEVIKDFFETSKETQDLIKQYISVRILSAPAELVLYVLIGLYIGLQKTFVSGLLVTFFSITNISKNLDTMLIFPYFLLSNISFLQ